MKPRLKFLLVVVVLSVLCSTTAVAGAVELTFTFWGAELELKVVTEAINRFNETHPDIKVTPMHIPSDYETKISAMVVGGTPPHVGYLYEPLTLDWATKGVLLDLTDYIKMTLSCRTNYPSYTGVMTKATKLQE